MTRYLMTFVMLLVILGWLVLSYMPQVASQLPQISLDSQMGTGALSLLAALTFLLFLVLQADLAAATLRLFRCRPDSVQREAITLFRLTRSRELFWTVLPLFSTVALAGWLWVAQL